MVSKRHGMSLSGVVLGNSTTSPSARETAEVREFLKNPTRPLLEKEKAGNYKVFLPIHVNTLSTDKIERVEIGTVCKTAPRTWKYQSCSNAGGFQSTLDEAAKVLVRFYFENPKTLGNASDKPESKDGYRIRACRQIARILGSRGRGYHAHCDWKKLPTGTSSDEMTYEDDVIAIHAGVQHGGLEIVRKPMPEQGMPGNNPCIMVSESGVCFRTHGESSYLDEHIEKLVKQFGVRV